MVEEARILVRESVVVLLPDMGGQQIVQRRDIASPRQFPAYLQPLRMLAEHRVDDANEGFVAVEQSMPPGQEIPFQPALALVLAQHGVQHAASRREELVVAEFTRVPLTIGDLEDRLQEVRDGFIRTEDTEVMLVLIQLGNIAQERTQHERIFDLHCTR